MAENSESFIYTQKHFELTEQELAKLDRFVRVNAAKFAAAGGIGHRFGHPGQMFW